MAVTVIWWKTLFLDKVNGSMCAKFMVCIVFRLARRRDTNKKWYRPEIWRTYSHWPYLKTCCSFFQQNNRDARYPEKLPCHVDFSLYLLDCVHLCKFIYLFIYLCQASWANEKQYRPEIWHTYSHWPYLKTRFSFFRQNDRDGRYPEKLPFHVDFSLYLLDCLVCKIDFDTIGSFWSTNLKNFWI